MSATARGARISSGKGLSAIEADPLAQRFSDIAIACLAGLALGWIFAFDLHRANDRAFLRRQLAMKSNP
ncbi:hypothetical protein CAF53_01545 [Sphingobium sp. LB126]|nr:hypothetical protein CAF53_01545 [Sphingobium sp. LB126]